MLKVVKKIAVVAILFTVVACAGNNDGRFVQANEYAQNYQYENSGE